MQNRNSYRRNKGIERISMLFAGACVLTFLNVVFPAKADPWPQAEYASTEASAAARPPHSEAAIATPGHPGRRREATATDSIITNATSKGVFSSYAIPIRGAPILAKWRAAAAHMSFRGDCGAEQNCAPRLADYSATVTRARLLPPAARLELINSKINGLIAYSSDRALYQQVDRWAPPRETLARGRGDCEDFAILKMAALLDAGVPSGNMSLVVIKDERRNVYHAVLSVRVEGETFILDNAFSPVVRDSSIMHYSPLISISGDRVWIHGRQSGEKRIAGRGPVRFDIAPGEGPLAE